jgi:hypothetical protein
MDLFQDINSIDMGKHTKEIGITFHSVDPPLASFFESSIS